MQKNFKSSSTASSKLNKLSEIELKRTKLAREDGLYQRLILIKNIINLYKEIQKTGEALEWAEKGQEELSYANSRTKSEPRHLKLLLFFLRTQIEVYFENFENLSRAEKIAKEFHKKAKESKVSFFQKGSRRNYRFFITTNQN